MANKETSTKSFVLRVDAETMDAIEAWAASFAASTDNCNGSLLRLCARMDDNLRNEK